MTNEQRTAIATQAKIDRDVSNLWDDLMTQEGAEVALLFSRDNFHELRSLPDSTLRLVYRLARVGLAHLCVTKMGGTQVDT